MARSFSKVCAQPGEGAGGDCLLGFHSHASIIPCSPEWAAQEDEQRASPNPLRFPYVEIEASSPALVKEKEPQTLRSFDLCCHISSSDCMQIEGIRKPLTFPHSTGFPLQLYPRWQNCGLDLQLDCQGQKISFHQNFPFFA